MNPIQINRITIARVFCRILCILYVVAAAWNDGVSTVVLGIPFGFYLLYDAYQIKDSNKLLSVLSVHNTIAADGNGFTLRSSSLSP